MLEFIVTGDEPGANRGAQHAARSCGMETRGPAAQEPPSRSDADGLLWFGQTETPAAQAAVVECQGTGRPCLPIGPEAEFEPAQVACWIRDNGLRSLHISGSREAEEPGIEARVESFLVQVFEELGHRRV